MDCNFNNNFFSTYIKMVYVKFSQSTNKDKKMMAVFYDDNKKKIKTVHFGAKGYSDYILSGGDNEKKKRYIERHKTNENFNDYMSAGSLSRYILWNKSTLTASINDYMKKFNLKKMI